MNVLQDGFMKSIKPYVDLCFVFLKKPKYHRIFKEYSKKIGISCSIYENDILIMGAEASHGRCYQSGYGKIGGGILSKNYFAGNGNQMYRIKDAVSGTGNYTFFKLKGHSLFACHDYFGLGSIYTYFNDDYVIITNRAHLAAIFSSISPRIINQDNIEALVLSSHHFRQDTWSDETPIKNLERVPLEKSVWCHNGKLYYINKNEGTKNSSVSSDYKTLLSNARKTMMEDLRCFQKLFKKRFVFDLSGGKDSRACVAPFIDKELWIRSNDVIGSRDLEISNQILSIYRNLHYEKNTYETLKNIEQNEALSIYRSYFIGAYYRLAMSKSGTFGSSDKVIISGGCGELLRTYWNVNKPDKCNSFRDWIEFILSEKEYLLKFFPKEEIRIRKYVFKILSEFLDSKNRPEEVMHKLYNRTRLRTHFGGRLYSTCVGSMIVYPLLNMDLYAASLKLSSEDMDNARLFYDFIKSCDEILANVDFDGNYTYQIKNRRYRVLPVEERLTEVKKEYEECIKSYSNANIGNVPDVKWRDNEEFINYELTWSILRIIQLLPEECEFFLKIYSIITEKGVQENIRKSLTTKVFSVEDFMLPLESMKEQNTPSNDEFKQIVYPLKGYNKKSAHVEILCYSYIDLSEYEYALYLHDNHKIQKKYWYQDDVNFKINNVEYDAMTLFARRKDNKKVFSKTMKCER